MKLLLIKVLFELILFSLAYATKCDRTPEGVSTSQSSADGRFKLRILGDPHTYVPGENYTISLEGTLRASHGLTHKFIGFYLYAEKSPVTSSSSSSSLLSSASVQQHLLSIDGRDSSHGKSTAAERQDGVVGSVGKFHISMGAISKFSSRCDNLVTHTNLLPKSDVLIPWTAPKAGSGCITFKSTVIEHNEIWYIDEGSLSKIFCEQNLNSDDIQPLILDECRACDEAKYELTFEGLWSRHTHPKDFPSNGWLTKFSDVIGASHTTEYRFWAYGEAASEGLREIAEHGSTRQLERELKEESEHIRTIIKARGIAYPNVTGKTFAVFRVDSKHHLVSLVSMVYPSPDWFVGVSGLELCLANGSWIENKVLNLYPNDAGTDSGPTYISPDQPTVPKDPIRKIKPNDPNDSRSPFHDTDHPDNKEMKPFAKLYLSRQRLYEKNCDALSAQDTQNECAVGKWGEWSKCDNPCGKGKRSRQRYYLNLQLAYQKECRKKLTDHEECIGNQEHCDEYDSDEDNDERKRYLNPECLLTQWTSFGPCSAQCGTGYRFRSRRYRKTKNHKKCQKMDSVELEQFIECEGIKCPDGNFPERKSKKKLNRGCKLSNWSSWSPCTAACGIGERMRVRVPIEKHSTANEHQRQIMKLFAKFNAQHRRNEISRDDVDIILDSTNVDDVENNGAKMANDEIREARELQSLSDHEILGVAKPNHPCFNEILVEKQTCGMRQKPCEHEIYGIPPFCLLEPKVGSCRAQPENRWYYNKYTQDCHIFPYTGCHGNKNNFETLDLCQQTCARKGRNLKLNRDDNSDDDDDDSETQPAAATVDQETKIDCEVTEWKRTPCNVTCGDGYRFKSRAIVRYPDNGGQPCPKRLSRLERCYVNCPKASAFVLHAQQQEASKKSREMKIQCEYGEWSNWTFCSKTCGDSSVQIRTRNVLNHQDTSECNERLEKRACEVLPCPSEGGIFYNYHP